MEKLQALLDKRAKLIKDWQNLLNGSEDGLNAEAKAKSDKMYADIEGLDAQIEALRKAQDFEAKLNEPMRKPLNGEPVAKDIKLDEYKNAFEAFVRGAVLTPEYKAVLNTGVGEEGGYIVPEEYQKTIIQKMFELSNTRAISNVITTKSLRNIPVGGELPNFAWVEENGAYGETSTNFTQKQLAAWKLGGIIKVSEELLQDSFINLESYLAGLIAKGLADAESQAFAVGDGTSKPKGYMSLDATVTLSTTDSITADELIDIYYALKDGYTQKATWRMNRATMKAIRKLKDGNSNYIYSPGLTQGERDTILGRNVELDPYVATLGAGNKCICFGDFSYYQIGDRGNIEIQKLSELYAGSGQIGFKVKKRVDAKPTLEEAFVIVKNADS